MRRTVVSLSAATDLSALLRVIGDIDTWSRGTAPPGRSGKLLGTGELRRPQPCRQPKQIGGMRGSGFIAALLRRMVVPKLAQNNRPNRSALRRRTQLPVQPKALAADATVDVLPKLRSFE